MVDFKKAISDYNGREESVIKVRSLLHLCQLIDKDGGQNMYFRLNRLQSKKEVFRLNKQHYLDISAVEGFLKISINDYLKENEKQ